MNYEIYYPLKGKIDNIHQLNPFQGMFNNSIKFQLINWELIGEVNTPYKEDFDNLEDIFFRCQNKINFWNVKSPCRSLSIGDIVRNIKTDIWYICATRSWKVIKMIEVNPSKACAVSDTNLGPR